MAQRKRGLGRGLDALFQANESNETGVQEIEVDAIGPNPYQPRAAFPAESLEDLARSIGEHGIIQPIIVTRSGEDPPYRLVAGERRWRAARLAGLLSIPALVRESSQRAMLEMALVENVQRADLSVIEEAVAYRQLIHEFGLTQSEVAERVGKSRVAITNALRVLDAPEEIRQAILDGQISEGHARALLGLSLAVEQLAALKIVLARDLNVRQTEQLVREWRGERAERQRTSPEPTPMNRRLEEGFRRALGTKVDLQPSRRGGRIVIHYFSDEELDGIYTRIVGRPEDEL